MSETGTEVDALLEYLRHARGFDFSNFKRPGLLRRITKRLEAIQCDGIGSYIDYLEVHPEEFSHLFNTILINVTSFFRDPPVWDYLAATVIPRMLESKQVSSGIRCWSAGSASGQEAYSLSMALAEAVGKEAFCERVKIYATDVDDEALNQARQASYSEHEVAGVPAPMLEKYFELQDNRYVFDKDMRRCIIFGRHDLFQDAPISRVDLLMCRNTLMYFNAEAQGRIVARFHFALHDEGFLILGRAETLLTQSHLFEPLDLRRRIFAKKARSGNLRDRLLVMTQPPHDAIHETDGNPEHLQRIAFESAPVAQLLVNQQGIMVAIGERCKAMLGLSRRDEGRPLQDLEISYRPIELRSLIGQAQNERRTIQRHEIEWVGSGGQRNFYDLAITPLLESGGVVGTLISFSDVTQHKRLQEELRQSNESLEAAQEELESTSEELETTNEELQSTVEELETTNEELQSTNEELETMNEELQSTNEELQTINDELRLRSDELNQVNSFLESILTGLKMSVVVVDQELRITVWNDEAQDLWGLRDGEVRGKHLLNLDIGLPVEELRVPLKRCLTDGAGEEDLTVSARNRRGKLVQCRVTVSPVSNHSTVTGAVLLIEELGGVEEE